MATFLKSLWAFSLFLEFKQNQHLNTPFRSLLYTCAYIDKQKPSVCSPSRELLQMVGKKNNNSWKVCLNEVKENTFADDLHCTLFWNLDVFFYHYLAYFIMCSSGKIDNTEAEFPLYFFNFTYHFYCYG